jgi:alanine racemase
MAVVKADGYGHGAVQVSRVALDSGADCLGVAIPEEGRVLREAGIEAPILVLGLVDPSEAFKIVSQRLAQTVASVELMEALDCEARKAGMQLKIHVKVDTGMGRIGITPEEVVAFIRRVHTYRNLHLEGVFSHFSCADKMDKSFSRKQLQIFERVLGDLSAAGIEIPNRHFANSAGILDLPESYYDMVRPGIMIYGLYPSQQVSRSIGLKPAMTLMTKIRALKVVPPGTPISYCRTFITPRKSLVATLPIGYADGYNRLLSNRGSVFIRDRLVPLIGQVCMDMCMADVTNLPSVKIGDEVILFGTKPSVDDLANQLGTIVNEVICAVGKRVPRFYIHITGDSGGASL